MPVSLVILILYIVALFAISWYAKKRSEGNNENFALAGRRLSAPLIVLLSSVWLSAVRRLSVFPNMPSVLV